MPSVEVILAAYNSPEFVAATLEGYLAQHDRDFSVAIADDGSGPEIAGLVGDTADRGLRMRHVWHEDRGYRKSRIVNRAIESSGADFIILTDSDCIPNRHFIADHRAWATPDRVSSGRKVELGPEITSGLMDGMIPLARLASVPWLVLRDLVGQLDRARYAVRLPAVAARLWSARSAGGAWGSNLGVWREDLIRVNGYDNEFEGWGGEDVDLGWRLEASGVADQPVRGRAVLFHLHHARHEPSAENRSRLEERRRSGQWRVRSGIVDEAGSDGRPAD